jgi:2'-5' RNA ligase
MNKRLFLAVELPFALKRFLSGQQQVIGRRDKKIAQLSRWTSMENLHITVLFLGSVPVGRIDSLKYNLKTRLAETPAIEFELVKIALAPPHGRQARMIWAYFGADKHYLAAVKRVRAASNEFMASELKNKLKAPLPHVTLARFKRPVEKVKLNVAPFERYGWRAEEISLWESKLGGGHPVYAHLADFKLKV